MSTQDISNSIPLSHAPDGTGYKLMELPPELLELLESQDPPTQVCLVLSTLISFTRETRQKREHQTNKP